MTVWKIAVLGCCVNMVTQNDSWSEHERSIYFQGKVSLFNLLQKHRVSVDRREGASSVLLFGKSGNRRKMAGSKASALITTFASSYLQRWPCESFEAIYKLRPSLKIIRPYMFVRQRRGHVHCRTQTTPSLTFDGQLIRSPVWWR